MKFFVFSALVVISSNSLAVGQAWLDGQAAGQSVVGRSAGTITNSNVANIGSTHTDAAGMSTLQGTFSQSNAGNVGLGSFGNQKITTCANHVPNPATPAKNQECAAVNDLAKHPVAHAVAETGINKNDSMFTNPNNMYNKGLTSPAPSTAIGSGTAKSGTAGAGVCLTTATTTPAVFTDQTCTRSTVPTDKSCQVSYTPTVTQTTVSATSKTSCYQPPYPFGALPPALVCTTTYSCSAGYTLAGQLCISPPVLTELLNNTCGALQNATSNPSANQATLINGIYACPTGKTLSGTICL